MAKYQGKNVRVVRDAREGDVGWDKARNDRGETQVLVEDDDKTQSVVQRSEVTSLP